ncbi:GNAT family N-acetyltransferase [Bacillus carboniphilus]|uniref:GNAT family N-acetyltransferase n=1 Tax=Bacillus carboniphilus TaxID=86663 RepID=A0ABN0WIM4_9BACI
MVQFYTNKEKPIPAKLLKDLYQNAGWWDERSEEDIESMLMNVISVGAWKDGVLVGFARAISDGRFRAYIEDVVVHSEYQRQNVGTQLMERLLRKLSHIDVISLFCEEHLIPFYKSHQFTRSQSQFVMHRK